MSDEREGNTGTDAGQSRPGPSLDKSADQIGREINQNRIAREKAHYDRGIPVAGHDNPAREAEAAAERELEKFEHRWGQAAMAEFGRQRREVPRR